ncbi:PKD domain-containing protein [bacterium]|nr:PKD domain-containing protein [bacterium]
MQRTTYTLLAAAALSLLLAGNGHGDITLHKRIDLSAHPVKGCRMSIGDLNGDGEVDFVFNDGRRIVRAFDDTGRLLWEKINSGDPGVEEKYHNFTISVYDIDLDGKDEVICFLEIGGRNHLAVVDGETGTVDTSVEVPFAAPRDHEYWGNDNVYMQDHTAIANLRGTPVPQDILAMHVSKQKVAAYAWENGTLRRLWYWVSDADSYASGHYAYPYDIDNDGRDEVLAGVDVLDEEGNRLWKMQLYPWKPSRPEWGMDHVDALSCADIDPAVPGKEIAVAAATGMWLYAADGRVLWHYPSKVTDPVNGVLGEAGIQEVLVGRFRPGVGTPEMVFYSEYMSGPNTVALYDREGNQIRSGNQSDGPRRVITYAMDWDGDRSRDEIYSRKGVFDHEFRRLDYTMNWGWVQSVDVDEFPPIICDVQGDQREEILWYDQDEILIIKNDAALSGPVLPSPRGQLAYRLRYANNNHCNAIYYDWNPPVPELEGTASSSVRRGTAPLDIQFAAEVTGAEGSWTARWSFGDGSEAAEIRPRHRYERGGIYRAVLQVRDDLGRVAADSLLITVTDPLACSAGADPVTGTAPLAVRFDATGTGGSEPYTWSWTFGDGGVSSEQSPEHTYTAAGTYAAVLTVTDGASVTVADTLDIVVAAPLACSASGDPVTGTAPLAVRFDGTVRGGTAPYTWSWTFGDGGASAIQSPAYTYSGSGTYSAVLTVEDATSATVSDTLEIRVTDALACSAGVSALTATAGEPLHFSAAAEGGAAPYTFSWRFGDGTANTGESVQKSFAAAGTYSTVLEAADASGGTASDTLFITVTEAVSQAMIADVAFTEVSGITGIDRIRADQWYDLIVYIGPPGAWEAAAAVDLWISAPGSRNHDRESRGGSFDPAANYAVSIDLLEKRVAVRQDAGSSGWSDITGSEGLFASTGSGVFAVSSMEGSVRLRLKLLPEAEDGYWSVHGFVQDRSGAFSGVYSGDIYVQSVAATPTANLEISGPVNKMLAVTLQASAELARVPGTLRFVESDQSETVVLLHPAGGNGRYSGKLLIDDSIAPGSGYFVLDPHALVDLYGNTGETIRSGGTLTIDKTPPAKPANIMISSDG